MLSRFPTLLCSDLPLEIQVLGLNQISFLSVGRLANWVGFGSDRLALLGVVQLSNVTLFALVELICGRCQYIQSLLMLGCLLLVLNLN